MKGFSLRVLPWTQKAAALIANFAWILPIHFEPNGLKFVQYIPTPQTFWELPHQVEQDFVYQQYPRQILNPLRGDYMEKSSAMDGFVQRVEKMYVWETQMGVTFINLVNTETKQVKKENSAKIHLGLKL